MLLKEKENNLDQEILKFINSQFINKSSGNIHKNKADNSKKILIKNKFSYNDLINNSRNLQLQNINYNSAANLPEDITTQKIFKQLKRQESELTKDLSKLIQNEKMLKDQSYLLLTNENPKNIILEKKKLKTELKQINENKSLFLSRLNEIKYRINSLEDKYFKDKGIYGINCKEKLETFLHNQINLKKNDKVNKRLKILQKQNDKLLLNMNTDAENKLKEKENKLNLEKEQEIENNLKLLDKIKEETKEMISRRKIKINEETKKMEVFINNKLEKKEYLYKKVKSDFNKRIKNIISLENKKRKNNMKSIELSSINDFMKNYEILKVKKHLELEKKTQILKKSWSQRGLLVAKYKNEISNIIEEEEKNRRTEKKLALDKKNAMKYKQINYSKKIEDHSIMTEKQYNIFKNNIGDRSINKIKDKGTFRPNIKLNHINNYCNLIRNKILTQKPKESNSLFKIKPSHIDLTKDQNQISFNQINTPNLKLPNLILNQSNINKNNETKYSKLSKNSQIVKPKNNKEIQNIIEKNGLSKTTLDLVKTKLENLKEKKEQKAMVLKHQGGFASNPELGEEVCDILINSIKAKMSLMDEIKKYVKKGNNNNLVDRSTGINGLNNDKDDENNEEELEEENENHD